MVEKIIDADAKEVVLNIPRFSKLADSLANFHLIKREAALLRKKLIIESVDDKVIELAGVAGLDSWNPILSRTKRQFTDIVSSRQSKVEHDEDDTLKKKFVESVQKPVPARSSRGERRAAVKRATWIVGSVLAAGALFFVANSILPRAEIKLTTVKTDWKYNDAVIAQKLVAVDPKTATVPGQVFTEKQTLQLSYPASGKRSVEQKATGVVTIYNAYSSDPQPLVATTRLLTPDGKIFRLAKAVIVPGAKVVEGSIIPSTLEADVIADQAGADYNIGPVTHFTIPGFKGTPKYSAFYAESKDPMAGGFIGVTAYPTDADLAKAKTDVAAKMQDALKQKIAAGIPADFKIIDGASKFTLLKQNVIAQPNSSGTFVISADGQISAIAFREADVVKMFEGKIAREKGADTEIKSSTISYGTARPDFVAGRMSFPVTFAAVTSQKVDVEALRQQVRGESENDLKKTVYSLPSIQTIKVSLWPFWVKSVPNNDAKISIVVD